jgi:hypothetical protein
MKQLILSLFVLTFLLNSCKKEELQSNKVDEIFEKFIEKFSADSLFQVSRVNFPLPIVELDNDYNPINKRINKTDYSMMDLRYNDSLAKRQYDKYTQKIKAEGNKRTIEIRGIDNGIVIDVYFEKRNGKWVLIGWNDSST